MKPLLKRTLAVMGVAALSVGGVAFTATSAQALPASVSFSDQNCDIDTGGTLGLTVNGVDLTVSNASDTDETLSYKIVLNFSDTFVQSVTLEPGTSQRHVIPLPEDEDTTVQVFDLNPDATTGLLGGNLASVNCVPNSSATAVATISAASCEFPSGGILDPAPGFLFTLDNSAGVGPADYAFVIDGEIYESGTVAAGDTRSRSTQLERTDSGTSAIYTVDANGDNLLLTSGTYDLDCDAVPAPDYNYSPEATGAVTDASCALPTGGTLVPYIAGVEFTLDNSDGTVAADYSFVAGTTNVESGTVEAGDKRVRSYQLTEDQATVVQVTSVDADGEPVVLDQKTVTLDCVVNVPTITSPTAGQVFRSHDVAVTGTGTAGDDITIIIADAELFATDAEDGAQLAAPAAPVLSGEGFTVYNTTVNADGVFSFPVVLANGNYGVSAVATRVASEDGVVPASVSAATEPVLFSVNVPVVTPVPTTPAGTVGGVLAQTGYDATSVAGIGALMMALGAGALLLFRRRRMV